MNTTPETVSFDLPEGLEQNGSVQQSAPDKNGNVTFVIFAKPKVRRFSIGEKLTNLIGLFSSLQFSSGISAKDERIIALKALVEEIDRRDNRILEIADFLSDEPNVSCAKSVAKELEKVVEGTEESYSNSSMDWKKERD